MATLKKDGIVKITDNTVKVARLKSLGYVEVEPIKPIKKEEPKADPTAEAQEGPQSTFDIDGMTVQQLKEFAETNGISVSGSEKKLEVIEKIQEALEQKG